MQDSAIVTISHSIGHYIKRSYTLTLWHPL